MSIPVPLKEIFAAVCDLDTDRRPASELLVDDGRAHHLNPHLGAPLPSQGAEGAILDVHETGRFDADSDLDRGCNALSRARASPPLNGQQGSVNMWGKLVRGRDLRS